MFEDNSKIFYNQSQSFSTRPSIHNNKSRLNSPRITTIGSKVGSNLSSQNDSKIASYCEYQTTKQNKKSNLLSEFAKNSKGKSELSSQRSEKIVCSETQQLTLLRTKINFLRSEIEDVEDSFMRHREQESNANDFLSFMSGYLSGDYQSKLEYSGYGSTYKYINQLQQLKIIKGQLRKRDLVCLQMKKKLQKQIDAARKQIQEKKASLNKINKEIYNSHMRLGREKEKRRGASATNNKIGNLVHEKIVQCQ